MEFYFRKSLDRANKTHHLGFFLPMVFGIFFATIGLILDIDTMFWCGEGFMFASILMQGTKLLYFFPYQKRLLNFMMKKELEKCQKTSKK